MSHGGRIGVVIPAYNSGVWLSRTLDSVLATRQIPLEIIVVDDGSTDGTDRIVEEYSSRDPRVRLIRQHNAMTAVARNRGLKALSPEVDAVMFLDHDDELEPGALASLSAALEADRDAVGAYGVPQYIGSDSEPIRIGEAEQYTHDRHRIERTGLVKCEIGEPATFQTMVIGNHIITPGQVLIRREAVDRLGGFDTDLRGPDDWDLWIRATAVGHLRFINQPVLKYRLHVRQVSKDERQMKRFRKLLVRKLMSRLPPAQRDILEDGQRWAHWLYSGYWLSWARDSLRARRWGDAAKKAAHALESRMIYFALSRKRQLARLKKELLA